MDRVAVACTDFAAFLTRVCGHQDQRRVSADVLAFEAALLAQTGTGHPLSVGGHPPHVPVSSRFAAGPCVDQT